MATRRLIRRARRRVVGTLALVTLVCAFGGLHYSGSEIGGQHHDAEYAAELCLVIVMTAGASAIVAALGTLAFGRWRRIALIAERPSSAIRAGVVPRARAGPPTLALLSVWRR